MPRSIDDHSCQLGREPAIELNLDGFAREAIEQESRRLGVPIEEVMSFAVLYYLADLDSGRIAREISASPYAPDSART